jgi:hypothetical protein
MPGKDEVARFIQSTFTSIWSLELLCFLKKHAEREWSPAEMVAALRASDLIVDQSLAALTAAGLVVTRSEGTARYQPATPRLETLAASAEAYYAQSPDAVRRMIVSAASSDLASFADAFRFRKD